MRKVCLTISLEIDITKLTPVQKEVDQFVRSRIPNLKDAVLSKATVDNDDYRYQYLDQNAPLRITMANVKRTEKDNKSQFNLNEATQLVTVPTNDGRITKTKKSYGISSFDDAVKNLNWG